MEIGEQIIVPFRDRLAPKTIKYKLGGRPSSTSRKVKATTEICIAEYVINLNKDFHKIAFGEANQ